MRARMLALLLAGALLFSGCVSAPAGSNESGPASGGTESAPTVDGAESALADVVKITVTTLPEDDSLARTYTSPGKIAAVMDYLDGLALADHFPEDPDQYAGMSILLSVWRADGSRQEYVHFGNLFLRQDGGDWKKMKYEDAARLETVLRDNPSDGAAASGTSAAS